MRDLKRLNIFVKIMLLPYFLFVEVLDIKVIKFIRLVLWDIIRHEKRLPYGVWMFVGLGGYGKTISMVEYLERMRKKHKGIKIYTNFEYDNQDGRLDNWKQLIEIVNEKGVIFAFDEISGTFNAKEWKTFPLEVFTLLAQSRKMKKQIICSAQSYEDVDVAIRRKANLIIECRTILGRWTFNRAFERPEYERGIETSGTKKRRVRCWRRSFVQDDSIRNIYDTYEQIKALTGLTHERVS